MTAPRTIPRSRLRRAGPPGASPLDWATRAAVAAFVLAGVWTAWALVRPLPAPAASGAADPAVDAPPLDLQPVPLEERRARIDELARLNRFASGGMPWKPKLEPLPAPAPDATAETPSDPVAVAPTVKADPDLTPLDRVPDDVKKALAAIELRGLRTDNEGTSLAMISRVHGEARSASTPYRVGDEFEEESNNQAKWRVVAIDWLQRRVLLSRSGVTVALPLYKGEATLAAARATNRADTADPGAPPALARQKPDPERTGVPGAPAVAIQERAAAIAQLRAAGVSEEDIAAIIAVLDEPPEKPARAPEGEQPERSGPPPGMEAILKMMQEQSKQAGQPDQPPPERPRRRRRTQAPE